MGKRSKEESYEIDPLREPDNDQQMIVIHLSCDNQQVVPVIQFLVFRHHILVLLLDISLDIPQSLWMGKEMQTASQPDCSCGTSA